MRLIDVIKKDCLEIGFQGASKDELLARVAELASSALGGAVDEARILNALKEREGLCSTGVGKGIAIPHCRLDEVENFVGGMITIPQGMEFHSLDGEVVRLAIFIVGPEKEKREHIHLLSLISQFCRREAVVNELLAAKTSQELWEILERSDPSAGRRAEKRQDMFSGG